MEEKKIVQDDHKIMINVVNYLTKSINVNGESEISLTSLVSKKLCKELIWVNKMINLSPNTDKFTDFTKGVKDGAITAEFYENANYSGWKMNLTVGKYTNEQLLALNGQFNTNGLSSLKTNGLKVILYTGNNFDNNKIEKLNDDRSLGLFNDVVRSIEIINDNIENIMIKAQLKLDSDNLFKLVRNYEYFNFYIPYKYYTGNVPLGINVYPFCLYPNKIVPSGVLDTTNVKKFTLNINCDKSIIHIFANTYNFIEITNNKLKIKFEY